jgi:hypothetical protein
MCDKKTENHIKSTKRSKLHVILILNRWIVASKLIQNTQSSLLTSHFFFSYIEMYVLNLTMLVGSIFNWSGICGSRSRIFHLFFYLLFLLIIFLFALHLHIILNKNDYWTPKPQPTTKEGEKEIKRVKW